MIDKILDIINRGLILIIAETVYVGVEQYSNSYTNVGTGQRFAYKLDKFTGETWLLAGYQQKKMK